MTAKRRPPRKSASRAARSPRRQDAGAAGSARKRALEAAVNRRNPTPEDVEEVRQVVSRAIRRLNVLETLILGAAVVIALAGGWLGALLAHSVVGLPVRTTWMVLSLLLFVIPGVLAWTMEKRRRRQSRAEADAAAHEDPTGDRDG